MRPQAIQAKTLYALRLSAASWPQQRLVRLVYAGMTKIALPPRQASLYLELARELAPGGIQYASISTGVLAHVVPRCIDGTGSRGRRALTEGLRARSLRGC